MTEKQIQEIIALVDELARLKHSQGMDDNSDFADRRRNADSTGEEADECRAAIESALREQAAAPVFEGVAKRKLDDLMAKGWIIDGYAISTVSHVDFDAPRQRGLITTGGMVCWWRSEEEIRQIERNAAERALREQAVPEGWALVPVEPTEDMLRPFYECPPEDLRLAWLAMQMFAPSAPQPSTRAPDAAVPSVPSPSESVTLRFASQPAQAEQPKAAQQEPEFEVWLRTACFQQPTPEAYDLARSAWIQAKRTAAPQREPMTDEQARASFEQRMLAFGWRDFQGILAGTPRCWYYTNVDLQARWIGWRESVHAVERFHGVGK